MVHVESQLLALPQDLVVVSQQHEMLPAWPQDATFSQGFSDCAQEAIDYLLEVEKLDENDPVVVGLKQHLLEIQHRLGLDENGHAPVLPPQVDGSSWAWDEGSSKLTLPDATSPHAAWDYQNQCSVADGDILADLCPQSGSQITDLTCQLIELLSDCPEWTADFDVSDSDSNDEVLDVAEDMEV